MSKITFRADDDLIQQLEEYDASKSEVLREALRAYLDEPTDGVTDDGGVSADTDSIDGLIVDALAALTRFRVELGHLEGPVQLCERCSPSGLATYWTRDLEEHLVRTPAE